MPLRAQHVTPRSTARRQPTPSVVDVPFDDLVYLLAAGVADAQTALDAHTAETASSLAETDVEVVPSITRTIDADGGVTTTTAPAERRSLLELGLAPAWYRFSEATIEVDVDVSVTDGAAADGRPDGERVGVDRADGVDHADGVDRADRTGGLRAGTQSVIDRRRFDREAGANARLVARLRPTPIPVRTGPADSSDAARGGDRAD
jgi:hypothetical protein